MLGPDALPPTFSAYGPGALAAKVRHLAQRPDELEVAIWYHDVVYDSQRQDNEAKSAERAKRELTSCGVHEEVCQRVDALIMNSAGIFGLYSLREVDQYTRFWAIGSGAEFALGAMRVAYDLFDTADEIARAGIEAGACFDSSSALPLSSYSMELS